MTTDYNGEAYKKLAWDHLQTAMQLLTAFMEDTDSMLRLLEHMEKGALPAVKVIAPAPGTGTSTLELLLCRPGSDDLLLQTVTMPLSVPTGQVH
jgi:hypothetical protein